VKHTQKIGVNPLRRGNENDALAIVAIAKRTIFKAMRIFKLLQIEMQMQKLISCKQGYIGPPYDSHIFEKKERQYIST
jgi:hypothetical protein